MWPKKLQQGIIQWNDRKRQIVLILLLAVLFLWPFLFVGKGIDGSDTCYCLANYKWVFEKPELTSSSDLFSSVTGAAIYRLLSEGHLKVFRILDILVYGIISACALYLCWDQKHLLVPVAVLCGSFCIKRGGMVLNYNDFSMLLFALTLVFALGGMKREKWGVLCLAGMWAGINVLFRTPNVLQFSVVAAIPLYGWKKGWELKNTARMTSAFLLGYAGGLLSGLAIACSWLGPEKVLAGYGALVELGTSQTSDHGIDKMVIGMLRDFFQSLIMTAPFLAAVTGLSIYTARQERKSADEQYRQHVRKVSEVLAILGGGVYGIALAGVFDSSGLFQIFMTAGLIVGGVSILLVKQINAIQSVWAWFVIISVGCIAAGTSNAFMQLIVFGAPIIGLTVALLNAWRALEPSRGTCRVELRPIATATMAMLLAIGIFYPVRELLFGYTYRDAPYAQLTETVKAPELAGMHTTSERATILDAFYDDVKKMELEEFPLATVGHFSVGYIISDCEPFFESVWPDLASYSVERYTACLERREAMGELPVIAVVDIGDGSGIFTSSVAEEKYMLLMDLAQRQGYICVRDDTAYKLYLPPSAVAK